MEPLTLGIIALTIPVVLAALWICILRVINRRSTSQDYVAPPPERHQHIPRSTDTGAGTGGIGGI